MVPGGYFFNPHANDGGKKKRLIEVDQRHVWERKRFSLLVEANREKKENFFHFLK